MEAAGVVARTPYQTRPVRHEYSLTELGESLLPVLQEICRWANSNAPGTWTTPPAFMER
jgi:DNA-binding HxlR family transcriptional regulator